MTVRVADRVPAAPTAPAVAPAIPLAAAEEPPAPPLNPQQVQLLLNGLGKDPWEIQIDVYLAPAARAGGSPGYTLETILPKSPAGRIRFQNRRRPGYFITFKLHGEPGYNFPLDPADAVWSQAGGGCPNAPSWQVFLPMEVDQALRTLTVYNPNHTPFGAFNPVLGDFQYTLRVTDGGAPVPLDPGGTNQNGNTN